MVRFLQFQVSSMNKQIFHEVSTLDAGFFINLNPTMAHWDLTSVGMSKVHTKVLKMPPQLFELYQKTIFGNARQDHSHTSVLALKCKRSDVDLVKDALFQVHIKTSLLRNVKFVSSNLHRLNSNCIFLKTIRCQNKYLQDITSIPLIELTTSILSQSLIIEDEEISLHKYLDLITNIQTLHPTNMQHCWILLVEKRRNKR